MQHKDRAFPLLVVTGLSGAGKSTALNVLEDLGFFSVDGLPASLVPKLGSLFQEQEQRPYRGLALGMDLRQRDFMEQWQNALDELAAAGLAPQIIFIEAKPDVLVRRYATTRRPHPLEIEGLGLEQAIQEEFKVLQPIRHQATLIIDTSAFSIHDLRRKIQDKWMNLEGPARGLRVHLVTFGFKYGVPSEADMVFDLRFLPNPYFEEDLRPLSGKDRTIADYVLAKDPGKGFLQRLVDFLQYLLPMYAEEGRYRLTIGIGCTGGRHRSVAVAEAVLDSLRKSDYAVTLEHRHLELG
jgi:UPF0042 nucleotide-binding protein